MPAQKKPKLIQQSNHFKVGALVYAKRLKQKAVIRQAFSSEIFQIEILANGLKLKETIDNLEILVIDTSKSQENHNPSSYHELSTGFAEIDLHGMRYDSALSQLANFLDQAILKHYSYIRVNHGKGSGALQAGVWRFLNAHSQVKYFQFAPQNLGGRGVTIVELK